MATKTLSASLDPDIYRAAQRAAGEERRPQSYVVAEALKLYTALPLEIRQLLSHNDFAESVSNAIRSAVLTSALNSLAARLPTVDTSESDIEALSDEAVRWARKQPGG